MIIDSSAIIAVLFKEPEAAAIVRILAATPLQNCSISAPTLLETKIVLQGRKHKNSIAILDLFIQRRNIVIVPFTVEMTDLAFDAYQRFHKPPARLNFGDCFSYALAKARNEPLLCKGEDFRNTDIKLVEY